jgi:hypothetical protein
MKQNKRGVEREREGKRGRREAIRTIIITKKKQVYTHLGPLHFNVS